MRKVFIRFAAFTLSICLLVVGIKIFDVFLGSILEPQKINNLGIHLNREDITLKTLHLYPYTGWHISSNYHHIGPMDEYSGDYQSFNVRSGDHGFYVDFDLENPPPKAPHEYRIILIGGSAAQGFGARTNDDMFYRLIEKKLNTAFSGDSLEVRVINMAMAGSITYQNFIALNKWGHALKPDLILSYSGGNDLVFPWLNESDAYFLFYPVAASVIASRHCESPTYLKWLASLFPNIFINTKIPHSLRILELDKYIDKVRREYITAYDRKVDDIMSNVVIPLYEHALKSIKRDFGGIPITIVSQPMSFEYFGKTWEPSYLHLIQKVVENVDGYYNNDWFFIDLHDYWQEHGLFESKKKTIIGLHLTNEGHRIAAENISDKLFEIIVTLLEKRPNSIVNSKLKAFDPNIYSESNVYSGIDEEHIKRAGLLYPHLLFFEEGVELINSLGKNVYGLEKTDDVLTIIDEAILFTPTHPDDHLATKFLNIAHESIGGGEWLKITLSLSESHKPGRNCVILIQDEKYNTISKIYFSDDGNQYIENGMLTKYVKILDNNLIFRLVIISEDGKSTYMPQSIKIEQSSL